MAILKLHREIFRIPIPYVRYTAARGLGRLFPSRFNAILAKIRDLTFPRSEYDRISSLWKQAFAVDTLFLPEWEEWNVIFERFRLDRRYPQTNLCESIAFLQAKGFSPPSDLRLIAALDLEIFGPVFAPIALIRAIWTVLRLTEPPTFFIAPPCCRS